MPDDRPKSYRTTWQDRNPDLANLYKELNFQGFAITADQLAQLDALLSEYDFGPDPDNLMDDPTLEY